MSYDPKKPLAERQAEFNNIHSKYPDRCPVIIQPTKEVELLKTKFLIKNDDTVASLVYAIRMYCKLKSDESIYLFCNNELLPLQWLMSQAYLRYKSDDGFLVIILSKESTFGLESGKIVEEYFL